MKEESKFPYSPLVIRIDGGKHMSNENEIITNEAMPEKWVNLEDIAEHLSVSTDTVRISSGFTLERLPSTPSMSTRALPP